VSPRLGSRDANTTVYFDSGRTELVCGCFSGTLAEFGARVHEIHGDNKYGKAYKAWIELVIKYMEESK
jgi:hypothetical protein